MHVIELDISNFMRIVAAHVAPQGLVVEVAGKNGAGKSTLLNAIMAVVGGADTLPEKPIRKGEKSASIRAKLGDDKPTLVATRTFHAKEDGGYTTHLFLEGPDGSRFAKPQTILDGIYGALTFDPFQFTRMKPREQLEQLRAFVPEVDFEAIEQANRGDFERRTDVNRQEKQARARLAGIVVPGDPRQERIDESALVAELEQAGKVATDIERERARRLDLLRAVRTTASDGERWARTAQDGLDRIAELEAEIARLDAHTKQCAAKSADAAARAAEQQAAAEALPALAIAPDTADIKTRLAEARARNMQVDERERALKERERVSNEAGAAQLQAATYTARIEERDRQKSEAVAAAKLPVDGLGFGADMVLLNGLPFDQASSAERLRVSVAVAAALNSKLQVALVRDASLLDDDSMSLVRDLAEKYRLQLWLEKVANDSATGIVIEDGRVKGSAEEVAA